MRLILVRHGESEANIQGILQGQSPGALTAKGRAQAQKLADRLRQVPFDLIISSDLQRASETARMIAETTGVPLELSPQLREWNVGRFDGRPPAYFLAAMRRVTPPSDFKPPGGESQRELARRAASFLNQLVEIYPTQTILLCSHGDFLKMLLSLMRRQEIGEAAHLHLDNTSVTMFRLDEQEGWVIEMLNNTDHLTELM